MALSATFVPNHIDVLPNEAATLTLRLYSDDADPHDVTLALSGDLSDHARLDATSASVETNQIVDVPVIMLLSSTVGAGAYTLAVDVRNGGGDVVPTTATAAVELAAHSDHTVALQPSRSRGSSGGRHVIRVVNTGNVVLDLDLSCESLDDGASTDLTPQSLRVPAGLSAEASLRIVPAQRYWSGPSREHGFVVQATSADGRSDELVGTFQQRPRVPNWLGPALAGAFLALAVGAIAWFAFMRPWVEDTADDAAAEAIEEDRAALRDRIDELEAAAAEAAELPFGQPIDVRLDVDPTGGNTEQASESADPGTIVSITDVVFQNPTGAVGTVTLRRDDEVILRSELANFRDFDLHFVAPYVFDDDAEVVLEVECRTPGAGGSTCPVGVSLVGFVDEVR
jgi:hypothetical protein